MKLLIFFLFFSINLFSQNNITGKVTDAKTGNPVEGASVFINFNYIDYSDIEGSFFIKNLPNGKYNIKISHLGYKSIDLEITAEKDTNILNAALEPTPVELDEVIVKVGRLDNYLRNSSYSEIIINSDEIQSKPFYSIPDVLQYEPGITLLRDGVWGTEVNLRGLSRENIITLIDGNRIITSTDIAARFSLIDQNDVERIEIIKGASSSIYGSGGTGGVINIISKTPQFSNTIYLNGRLSTGYNSVNNSTNNFGTIYAGSSYWAGKLSASYRNADNVQTPIGLLSNSQFKDYSLSGSLLFKTFEDHKFKIDYQKFKAEDVGIPGGSVFPVSAQVRYPEEVRELISGSYEIQNISKVLYNVSAKYAYQFIERDVENIPNIIRNIPSDGTNPARRISVLKITPGAEHKSNNFNLQSNLLLSSNSNFVVGLDYWDRKYSGQRENYQKIEVLNASGTVAATNYRVIGEKPLPDAQSQNYGIYLQNETGLIKDKFSFSIGLRVDKILIQADETRNPLYEIVNGNQNPNMKDSVIWYAVETDDYSYSSNLGLRYVLHKNLDLVLSLGISYRSPSLEERFQFIDQGSYVRLGNPNLNSEYGRSADLGFRYYHSNLKFVSSIFYNYFSDLVVEERGMYLERAAFFKTNVGEARLYGFDLTSEYNFYKDFIFYLNASYVKGEDVTFNQNLPGIPPFNLNTGFRFGLLNLFEADISALIFAEQNKTATGEIRTPGYATFNMSFNSVPIDLNYFSLQLYAGIENLLDKGYRNHLSTTRGQLRYEPGRNFYFRISAII